MSKLALVLPGLLQGAQAFILLPATGPAVSGGDARFFNAYVNIPGACSLAAELAPNYVGSELCAPRLLHVHSHRGSLLDIRW